jgi:glycosyltransferase involved in cell wall biosynthesis
MRICIVTHTLVTTDGQGRINYEIIRHLAQRGHTFVLVSTLIDPALPAMPGVTWRHVPLPKLPTALLKYMVFARRARKVIDANGPYDILQTNGDIVAGDSDVNIAMFVHSNWIKSPYHATWKSAGLKGLYYQMYTRLHARWERKAFHRTRRAVALSAVVKQSLITDLGLPADKIDVIMPGVDIEQFRPLNPGEPNPLRPMINAGEDLVVFFVGDMMSNRKNLDLILNAMKAVGPGVRLVCAGNFVGSVYPPMAAALGIADRVHFIGKRLDLGNLFRGADCFAFPSHYDTFGLVITESMASGLAVITAKTVGASSCIEPGVNGIVLDDSQDLAGMTAALSRMMSDRTYADGLGTAARKAAEAWTWADMAGQYETLYVRLMTLSSSQK